LDLVSSPRAKVQLPNYKGLIGISREGIEPRAWVVAGQDAGYFL
jgi:hypothetical protein